MNKLIVICVVLICMLSGQASLQAGGEFRMITLQYRFAHDVLPVIEPLVGPEGSVRALDNHLMISTSPERHAQIEALIAQLDVARRNLRITVSRDAFQERSARDTGASVGIRTGDVSIESPRGARSGVAIGIEDRAQQQSLANSQFLTVMEGERAYIQVGQSIPYTQQWQTYGRRYASVQQTVVFQEITTGFSVWPRLIGDEVELQIAPSMAGVNQSGVVEFESLRSTVRLKPGIWLDIGGTMLQRDEVSREILGRQQMNEYGHSALRIRVD